MRSLRQVVRSLGVFLICTAGATLVACTRHVLYSTEDWRTPLPPGVSSDPATFLSGIPAPTPRDSVHVRVRPGNCPFCIVEVRVQTIGNTHLIDPDNGPSPGMAIARIENLDDTDMEAVFGFRPQSAATYFFWVDRGTSGKARLTVLQVPRSGGLVTAGHQKLLRLCHPRPTGQLPTSDVDFAEYRYKGQPCYREATDKSVSEASLSFLGEMTLFRRVVAHLTRLPLMEARGGWIDCNSGCCT
jgi:hypothetical protein